MDIEQRLNDLTVMYERLYEALEKELKRHQSDAPSEKLEDLRLLRETALVLIGGLRDFRDSSAIPFDIDLNELSLIIDDFISTSNEIMKD